MKKIISKTITALLLTAMTVSGCGSTPSENTGAVTEAEKTELSAEISETSTSETTEVVSETSLAETSISETIEVLPEEKTLIEVEYPYVCNDKTYEKVTLENLCTLALPKDLEIGEYSKYAGFGGGYLVGPQIYTDNWELSSSTLNMAFVGSYPKEYYVFKINEEGFINPETITPAPKAGFEIIDFVEVLENTEKNCIIYSYTYDLLDSTYLEEGMSEEELGKFWIAYIVEKEDEAALELKFSKAYFTLEEVEFMAQSVRFN